ncbi:hypothetical protein JW968_05960 [Candidatus Woesearchaeota archaeon]|nr:hypothetical protein [Candidatus Woesearchaeota archaeon]
MAKDEIDEIRKLSPRERIEKLRKLEETRKKELTEAEKLISDSIREIEDEQRITKLTQRVEMPAPIRVDVDRLFEAENDLEKKVAEAPAPEGEQRQYQTPAELTAGPSQTYSFIKDMGSKPPQEWVQGAQYELNRLKYADSWSSKDVEEFYAIEKNLEKIARYRSLSSDVQEQVNVSQSIVDNIRKYKQ